PEAGLVEVSVCGKRVTNSQLAHHNKAGQIRERHARLIAKAEPQIVRTRKRSAVIHSMITCPSFCDSRMPSKNFRVLVNGRGAIESIRPCSSATGKPPAAGARASPRVERWSSAS